MRLFVALVAVGAVLGLVRRAGRNYLAPLLLVVLLPLACTRHRALPVTIAPNAVRLTNETDEALTVIITIPARSDLVIRTVQKGHR